MKRPRNLIAARTLSLLALLSVFALPWLGWRAIGLTAVLLLIGALITPRPISHAHKRRIQSVLDGMKRRLVRHAWRPRGL